MTNIDTLKKEYNEKGWTVIRGLYSEEQIAEVIENIDVFYNKNKDTMEARDINFSNGNINSIHCLHKYDNSFFKTKQNQDDVLKVTDALLNDSSECRGSEVFLKPAKDGLKSPFHQDDFYWCVQDHNALTVWIALDDADEENGGLTYYEGTHKLGLLEHENSNAPGSSQQVKDEILNSIDSNIICPELKKGDALIHHALLIHGSSPNNSDRSRRGFTLQYKGANSAYDQERKDHYLSNLQKQINERAR